MTTDCCGSDDLLTQLTSLRADLAAIKQAITAVSTGAQQYSLNTGQTQQMVTKASLRWLIQEKNDLQQEISGLELRCNGRGVTRVAPNW
jgi:hypothetical protein